MTTIGYIRAQRGRLTKEEAAGLAFARARFGIRNVRVISLPRASSLSAAGTRRGSPALLSRAPRVIWWHFDASKDVPQGALDPAWIAALRSHLDQGGSLLLTLLGAQYVVDLGIEEVRPNILVKGPYQETCWVKSQADIRGLAGRGSHPVFDGLHGGAYTWRPQEGTPFAAAYYSSPFVPQQGRVVALEWEYHRINERRIQGVEYTLGAGRVLAFGAHWYFAERRNPLACSLEQLAANCIRYLDGPPVREAARRYWSINSHSIAPVERQSEPAHAGVWHDLHRPSGSRSATGDQFDLSGMRLLLVGEEASGIEEIWAHPLRIVHGLTIAFHGEGEVGSADPVQCAIAVRSESITRIHELEDCVVEETLFADRKLPGGAIHFRRSGMRNTVLALSAHMDLRQMWPVPEAATGPLTFAWDTGLRALVVTAEEGHSISILGASREPLAKQVTAISGEQGEVVVELEYLLDASQNDLTVVFAGSSGGIQEAEGTYRSILEDTSARLTLQVRRSESVLRDATLIEGPDEEFNAGYCSALLGSERFMAETPGVGVSLMAGFAPSSRTWEGLEASGARPGRAWFISREALWTSLGLLSAGMFNEVKQVLTFLGDHQDDRGKILHEMTTSGYADFEAADATPLYLLLMGRYLRTSADTAFVRSQSERIVMALAFCSACDLDGDGLMENTSAGHGWVEEGKLSGAHVELYLAACWGAALSESTYVAAQLGHKSLALRLRRQSKAVARFIRRSFWNQDAAFFNFALEADGSSTSDETAFAALPLYFAQADPKTTQACLDRLASWQFSVDWGTRLASTNSTRYNPAGRQEGSVLPLMTGWTALAEFTHGRPAQGFSHALSTMLLSTSWSAGNIPDSLHGERMALTGVCPHYASSGAVLLQVLLEGMLGIECNAPDHSMRLRPYFPPHWEHGEVHNIRIGNDRLSVSMRRRRDVTSFRFLADGRKAIHVAFRPWFPLGTRVHGVRSASKSRAMNVLITSLDDLPEFDLRVLGEASVDVHHVGGISIIPPVPHPRPGETSSGLRLIREAWVEGMYEMLLEGRTGMEYALEVSADITHVRAEGAGIAEVKEGRLTLDVQFEGADSEFSSKLIRVYAEE